METITLQELRDNFSSSDFESNYDKMLLNENLNESEILHLLKMAIYFLNFGDIDLQKMGYKIVVNYSVSMNDFRPLYDVALNSDYIPISHLIENKHFDDSRSDRFFNLLFTAYQDNFKGDDYYLSKGQKMLIEFSKTERDYVIVAPTSYGKSEIIMDKVYSNLDKKVCVIVPSKALLAQTKQRLLSLSTNNNLTRIVTHPEMYKGTELNFVSVLTQERLLRLLQKNNSLAFDLVLIDEAHNLFGEKDYRGIPDTRAPLLAQTLMIIKKRNANAIFNFFSPFIHNPRNLEIKQLDYTLESKDTKEFIKSEKFLVCDLTADCKLKIYNQFTDDFIETNKEYSSHIELIKNESVEKNIIYFNRPKHIEEFALKFSNNLDEDSESTEELISTISDFIHPEYNLLECIKKGVAYHHGGVPELIRLYVEDLFKKRSGMRYIITSSTLLEGVNIPAEKMFLMSVKKGVRKLSKSQFKNLIGRVNRFSEIFNSETGDLKLLEPQIYIIKNEYSDSRIKPEKFLTDRAKTEIEIEDEINNVLIKDESGLNAEEKLKLHDSLEYLENIEPNTTKLENPQYVNSEIGKLCYQNNIYDFDIRENETNLVQNLERYIQGDNDVISNSNQLVNAINAIFIQRINIVNDSFKRLENDVARNFYSMILGWRSESTSFKQMINSFLYYWSGLGDEELQHIYVGQKWGEIKRTPQDHVPLYVDLSGSSTSKKVNVAILKIKEEQDYIEFNVLKYIEIIMELELLDSTFYEKIKYGSSNRRIITLLKNGFTIELAKCLIKSEYLPYISINVEMDDVIINEELIMQMMANEENNLLIFEAKFHINQ